MVELIESKFYVTAEFLKISFSTELLEYFSMKSRLGHLGKSKRILSASLEKSPVEFLNPDGISGGPLNGISYVTIQFLNM